MLAVRAASVDPEGTCLDESRVEVAYCRRGANLGGKVKRWMHHYIGLGCMRLPGWGNHVLYFFVAVLSFVGTSFLHSLHLLFRYLDIPLPRSKKRARISLRLRHLPQPRPKNTMSASHDTLPPGVPPTHRLGPLTTLINNLRAWTKESAPNQQSDDLGTSTVPDGNPSDTPVPVFFRCTWPAGRRSRHALIWMKPSIPDAAFGSAVNRAFRVLEANGAVKTTAVVWIESNPFTEPTEPAARGVEARGRLARAVGLSNPPTMRQNLTMMGETMNGFIQVVVEPLQNALRCLGCGRPRPIGREVVEALGKSAVGVTIFCPNCLQNLGMEELRRIHERREDERRENVTL